MRPPITSLPIICILLVCIAYSQAVAQECMFGLDNVTAVDEGGRTSLHLAAEAGNVTCVAELITQDADVNATDDQSDTPLHRAAEQGCCACVLLLTQHGIHINAVNKDHETALHQAVKHKHAICIHPLIEAGADVNALSGEYYQYSVLNLAAISGCSECITTLTGNGSQVDPSDGSLYYAAMHKHAESVKNLILAGADVDQANSLHAAAHIGCCECIVLLAEAGADMNAADALNRTALAMAAGYYQCECVPVLIQYGSDISLVKGERYTSACPVDGGWSSWESWSSWNGTCDSENSVVRHRSRICSSPPPVFGGQPCNGTSQQNQTNTNCHFEDAESNNDFPTSNAPSDVSTTPKLTSTKILLKMKTTTKPKTTPKPKTASKNRDYSNTKSAPKVAATLNSGTVASLIGTKINLFVIPVIFIIFTIE